MLAMLVLGRFHKEDMTSLLDYYIYICKRVCSKSADSSQQEKPYPTFRDFQKLKSAFVCLCNELNQKKVLLAMSHKTLRRELEKRLNQRDGSLDEWKKEMREWYRCWDEEENTTEGAPAPRTPAPAPAPTPAPAPSPCATAALDDEDKPLLCFNWVDAQGGGGGSEKAGGGEGAHGGGEADVLSATLPASEGRTVGEEASVSDTGADEMGVEDIKHVSEATPRDEEKKRISEWADRIIANEHREREIAGVEGHWKSGNELLQAKEP